MEMTSASADTNTQPPHCFLHMPAVIHVRGYRKVDAIGSPDPPLLHPLGGDDGATDTCSTDSSAPRAASTPPLSPSSRKLQDEALPARAKPRAAEISMVTYRILYLTELPFLIMWTYATYWTYLVVMYANQVRTMIWLSAAVAAILVGVGLNANAYEMLSASERIDYGVVIRFFVIPFGVSSLSGMTNQLRDQFLLVFPRDPVELLIAILLPACVVLFLFFSRLLIISQLSVPWSVGVVFMNTKEIKSLRRGQSLLDRLRCIKKVESRPASRELELHDDSTVDVSEPTPAKSKLDAGKKTDLHLQYRV